MRSLLRRLKSFGTKNRTTNTIRNSDVIRRMNQSAGVCWKENLKSEDKEKKAEREKTNRMRENKLEENEKKENGRSRIFMDEDGILVIERRSICFVYSFNFN